MQAPVSPTGEPPPRARGAATRLVARQISELLIARSQRWQWFMRQDRAGGIVFEVVCSASIAHYPFRDAASGRWLGIQDAALLGRPVSGAAIAQSMNLSIKTARRRAVELVEAGLLVQHPAGFTVVPGLLATAAVTTAAAGDAEHLARILATLARAGFEPAARALSAGFAALPPGLVERVLQAFSLRTMETFSDLYADYTSGTIVAAIIAANVRHVTEDDPLAQTYAAEDAPPPDALRRPIALRALARSIELPFETVRRRVQGLIAEGIVETRDDGVIVPKRVLLADRHLANNRRIVAHFDQMVSTLTILARVSRQS